MKKTILLLIGILSFYGFISNVMSKNELKLNDAIRLRVVANSNSEYDQKIKINVKTIVEEEVSNILNGVSEVDTARYLIKNNLHNIDSKINYYLKQEKYPLSHTINYGQNYFPEKTYGDIKFKEGNYESLLITLGNGLGNNWWCIMYPPLCLIEVEEGKEIEYKSFINELIEKYL